MPGRWTVTSLPRESYNKLETYRSAAKENCKESEDEPGPAGPYSCKRNSVCVCVASCALIYFHRSNWLALSNYLDAFYPKWENNVPWRTINFQFLWLRSPIRCYAFPHSILQRWRKGIHSETKWEPMTAKFGCIWVSFSSSFFFHNSHYFLSFFLFFNQWNATGLEQFFS